MASGRAGGLGWLLVALALFLVAPHAAPTLERASVGEALRRVAGRLPELARPDSGGAPSPAARRAVAFALAQRGKPYRWGAEGPGAFDCSGLTWAAWRAAGLRWPRLTAEGQWRRGPRVAGALRPGDLVFFHTRRVLPGRAGHVGVFVGGERMVEAPNRRAVVRVASIDRPGYLGAVRPAGSEGR